MNEALKRGLYLVWAVSIAKNEEFVCRVQSWNDYLFN